MSGGSGWLWATTRDNVSRINTVSSSVTTLGTQVASLSSSVNGLSGGSSTHSASVIFGSGSSLLTGTTSETVLRGYTIPSGSLVEGTVYRLSYKAVVKGQAGATDVTTRVRLGGLTGSNILEVQGTGPLVGDFSSGQVSLYGVSSAASGSYVAQQATAASFASQLIIGGLNDDFRFDTSGDLDLVLTGQLSSGDATSIHCESFMVEKITE